MVELFGPDREPDRDGHDGGGNGAGQDELAWPVPAARTPPLRDPRA